MKNRPTWTAAAALIVVAAHVLAGSAAAQDVPAITADELDALVADKAGSVVVVNFWATWCAPCLREFPDIIEFYNENRASGVEVVAVSMDSPRDIAAIGEFMARFAPPFAVYRAATQDEAFYRGVLENWYGEMPTTVIYDTNGNRAYVHKKPLTHAELAHDVRELLASR